MMQQFSCGVCEKTLGLLDYDLFKRIGEEGSLLSGVVGPGSLKGGRRLAGQGGQPPFWKGDPGRLPLRQRSTSFRCAT
jgi:hypothetical protein